MTYCKKCGATLQPGMKFCTKCGNLSTYNHRLQPSHMVLTILNVLNR